MTQFALLTNITLAVFGRIGFSVGKNGYRKTVTKTIVAEYARDDTYLGSCIGWNW